MKVKELKEIIKDLNDDVLIHISTPFHLGTEVIAKKYSNFGRDSNNKDCIWLCLTSEDARPPTGVDGRSYNNNLSREKQIKTENNN